MGTGLRDDGKRRRGTHICRLGRSRAYHGNLGRDDLDTGHCRGLKKKVTGAQIASSEKKNGLAFSLTFTIVRLPV